MHKYSILAGCLFIASVAQAQNPNTANGYIPTHAYQGNDIDTVDVGSGNLTIKIPIRSYKQEGSESIDYYLYFPGKHFEALNGSNGESGSANQWSWIDPRDPFPWDNPDYTSYFGGVYLMTNQDWHSVQSPTYGIEAMSPDGARHLFIQLGNTVDGTFGYPPERSADASGYAMGYNGILDSDGVGHSADAGAYYVDRNFPPPQTSIAGAYTYTDINGDAQSYSLVNLIDLSGRVLPYTGGDGPPGKPASISLCPILAGEPAPTSAFEVDFPGAANPTTGGNYDAYIFCYAPVAISTNFPQTSNQVPLTQFDQTLQFLQAVVLPNGQSWKFQYDDGYGDLTQVTYPTGAYTQYSYQTNPGECLIGGDSTQYSRYLAQKIEHSLDAPPATWTYSLQLSEYGSSGGEAPYGYNYTVGYVTTPDGTQQTYQFAEIGSDGCPASEVGFLDGKGGGRLTVNTITGYTALDPEGVAPTSGFTYSPRFQATWGPNQAPVATSKYYDEELTPFGDYTALTSNYIPYIYISHGSVLAEFTYPYTGGAGPSSGEDLNAIALEETQTGLALDTYMQSPVGNPTAVLPPTGALPTGISKYVKTDYEYQSNTAVANDNLINLVTDKTVYDGSMNVAAQTVNTYDDSTSNMIPMTITPPSGSPYTIWWPGFLASTSTWLNTDVFYGGSTDAIFATQTFTPDAHAEVASATDANGNTTSYGRDSNDVYITSVTRGEHTVQNPCGYTYDAWGDLIEKYCPSFVGGLTTQSTYDPGTGQIATQTDENGNTTSYTYGPMARLVKVQPPATAAGQPEVDLCYTDLQSCPVVSTTPLTIVSQTKQSASGTPVTISQTYDDFGRPIKSVLYDSTGPIETDTAYDFLGRKISVSNPYRSTSDPTYGLTTYTYPNPASAEVDTTTPDGTLSTDIPVLGVETITGPNPKVRTSDIFGNLISVVAPIGAGTYTYDLNNNLTSANGRTFTYDAASRLLTSNNPETGLIHYSYDGVGNLISKTDARGVVTTMTYDALNRIVSKAYSGIGTATTPMSCYLYDNAASGANGIGRLLQEWTASANSCSATQPIANHYISSYDSGGRILQEERCVTSSCVQTTNTYDLAGNLTQYTKIPVDSSWNPLPGSTPVTIQNVYDSANRLQQVLSQIGTSNPWSSMYSVNSFGPAGPTSTNIGSAMTTTHTYDFMMRPTSGVTVLNNQ